MTVVAAALAAFAVDCTGAPARVPGGELHRTWRVPTADGDVAVKLLGVGVHPTWAADLERSVAFERTAWAAGTVPVAEPLLTPVGAPLVRIDGHVARAHRWVDGLAGHRVAATPARLRRIGATVAAIVALGVEGGTTADALEWNGLDAYAATVAEAHDVGAPFAPALAALAEEVEQLRTRMAALAARRLPMVLGHGDVHPRNSVVADGIDVLIDWDEAAPVVPASHLLDAAIGFSGGAQDATEHLVRAALDGWAAAGGGPVDLAGATIPIANTHLRAVLFHTWRALGHRGADDTSRARSADLVARLAPTWADEAVALRTWEDRLA